MNNTAATTTLNSVTTFEALEAAREVVTSESGKRDLVIAASAWSQAAFAHCMALVESALLKG